jgi:formylglycine-generating enzyme required for sulfatase activity
MFSMLGPAVSPSPIDQSLEPNISQALSSTQLYLSLLRQQQSVFVFTNQRQRRLAIPLKELFVAPRLIKQAARNELQSGFLARISQLWKKAPEPQEDLSEHECEWNALFGERAVALLGEAGSGKTSLLRYCALRLSEIRLENARSQLADLGLPISSDIPFPLLIQLDRLPKPFWTASFSMELLCQAFSQLYPELPTGFLAEQLADTPSLLLIDGTNRLHQASYLSLLRLLSTLVREYPQSRVIVSARSPNSPPESSELDRFVQMTIQPFSKVQQREFIGNWSRFFFNRLRLPQAEQQAFEWSERCWQQIEALPAANHLASNPRLLGTLVLQAQHTAQLPKMRKQLYSACCDLLLEQTCSNPSLQSKRDLLEQIAYQLQVAHPHGLSSEELYDRLDAKPKPLLDELLYSSGLLQIDDQGIVSFQIPQFRAFLAACALCNSSHELGELLLNKTADQSWHDCILFCLELLPQHKALALLEQLNPSDLCAEDQLDMMAFSSTIVIQSDEKEQSARLRQHLRERAYTLWQERQAVPALAQRCGELFGLLGDPRQGVCDLPPALVALPAASFQLGYSEEELEQFPPQERFLLEDTGNTQLVSIEAFEIARYPISNAQFQAFIDDHGYTRSEWWDFGELPALQAHREQQGVANQAVTHLTWYEAQAFCQWLTAYLDDGYSYTLPSEVEWEYAARGLERRHFAWGDELHQNTLQAELNLKAVGCSLQDYTPSGIADLGVQIIEWTRSSYADYPYQNRAEREQKQKKPNDEIVCRGRVPWRLNHKPYAAYRYAIPATQYDAWLGFRIIRRPKA